MTPSCAVISQRADRIMQVEVPGSDLVRDARQRGRDTPAAWTIVPSQRRRLTRSVIARTSEIDRPIVV